MRVPRPWLLSWPINTGLSCKHLQHAACILYWSCKQARIMASTCFYDQTFHWMEGFLMPLIPSKISLYDSLDRIPLNDWLIDWLIDWMIEWLIDWLIGWLVDWLIEWLVDWLIDQLIVQPFIRSFSHSLTLLYSVYLSCARTTWNNIMIHLLQRRKQVKQ